MSAKHFCDGCGAELTTENLGRIDLTGTYTTRRSTVQVGRVKVAVSVRSRTEGHPDDSDLCRGCVIDAVMSLDTRPRGATA